MAKLGFSPSEIKIYLHLYRHGSSFANKISSEVRINRTNIYEALERLISKGVVSFIIKNKVKWFEAKPPEAILSLIQEKEEELAAARRNLLEEIKEVKASKIELAPLEATIGVGKKGLRMIFEEILETRKPIALMASKLQFKELFGPYFELWHKRRIGYKTKQRTIISELFRRKIVARKFLEYKFIANKLISPTTIIIYGDTCVFIQWSKEPLAIKVKNTEIAKSHLNYFNLLWEKE